MSSPETSSPLTGLPADHISIGTPEYRRAALGMCASGFATFALLYCVQPLMPIFSHAFAVSPASASLSLSCATLVMTVAIFLAGIVSERFGRKRIMAISLFSSVVLNLLCAAAPGWHALLALRTLEGIAAAGVPAVAMAYLSEEMHPNGLSFAMGIYVAGNAFGGMLGRLLTGAMADLFGWRVAMAVLSLLGLAAAMAFVILLPPSRHWRPAHGRRLVHHVVIFRRLLRQPSLRLLIAFGFLVVGPFVSLYNYTGYRLSAPPYNLGQTTIGAIFLVYVFGIAGSTVFGRAADRIGRSTSLFVGLVIVTGGLLVTLAHPLAAIITGIALVTFGFFGAHSVASAAVGRLARQNKGHASALYLFAFYTGLSVFGAAGGWFWQEAGWPGVVAMAVVLAALALLTAWRLRATLERGSAP